MCNSMPSQRPVTSQGQGSGSALQDIHYYNLRRARRARCVTRQGEGHHPIPTIPPFPSSPGYWPIAAATLRCSVGRSPDKSAHEGRHKAVRSLQDLHTIACTEDRGESATSIAPSRRPWMLRAQD